MPQYRLVDDANFPWSFDAKNPYEMNKEIKRLLGHIYVQDEYKNGKKYKYEVQEYKDGKFVRVKNGTHVAVK